MASNLFQSNTSAATALAAIGVQLNSGFIDIYAGSSQPLDANSNTTASHYLLAELAFGATAGTAASSTWTANAITATTATSSGIALFYRAVSSSRVVQIDGSISTAASDMNFNTNNFAQGASVSVTSYVLILPEH
jgi:hypothetical protein